MSFTVKGTLDKVLQEVKGTSAKGEWKKQEFVITTDDSQYPRIICFTLFNDKVSLIQGIAPGSQVEVSFVVESREYQGRYFHNVNAWRIAQAAPAGAPEVPTFDPTAYQTQKPTNNFPEANNNDDLPF